MGQPPRLPGAQPKRRRLHERRDRRIHAIPKRQSNQPDDAHCADQRATAANGREVRHVPGPNWTLNWVNTGGGGAVMVSAIQIVNAASGSLPVGTPVQLGPGTAALDLNGVNQQVAAVRQPRLHQRPCDQQASGVPVTLTLSPAGGSSTFSGAIEDGAGEVRLAVSGSGTQVLAGSGNAYGGGTTISAGTLQIGDGGANAGSLPGNVVVSSTAAGA